MPVDLWHGLTGFRIPALPVASQLNSEVYLVQLLHRFTVFVRSLHTLADQRAVALHVVAHHGRSRLGAEVGVYLLCRAAHKDRGLAHDHTKALALQIQRLFPTEGLFNYDVPKPLPPEKLDGVTFRAYGDALKVVELKKFLEPAQTYALEIGTEAHATHIPHPFFGDVHLDPWLSLVEVLAKSEQPTVISVALEPTKLWESPAVAELAERFGMVVDYGERRRDLFMDVLRSAGDSSQTDNLSRTALNRTLLQAKQLSDTDVARAQRGNHAYGQLLTWQDQIFKMRITLAAPGGVNAALVQSVAAALCAPSPETPEGGQGWYRPDVVSPTGPEIGVALRDLWGLGVSEWGAAHSPQLQRVRRLVTAQEAVALFHLPMMPQAGQTSALSTVDVPFVIPPEVASTERHRKKNKADQETDFDPNWFEVDTPRESQATHAPVLRFGYLYQRNQYLGPTSPEDDGVPFELRLTDLKKPSLLVGAPGSGKSNLALYLLIQLWRDHGVPFLVLDPSTGHEYRYLYQAPHLEHDLVVYTVGDNEGFPLRFNPFAVPPGVTVRAHITRLLACFKAAYEMWDPLPAIYEAALARVYADPRFGWQMDEKWGGVHAPTPPHPFPCLADFVLAIEDEIEENVKPNYGRSEAGSALTGASQIRINGVLNSVGHVINVRQDDVSFFETLLKKPAVIELGALGDPGILALVMAFLITQLAGYIEHAAPPGEKREQRQHLLLIDEAHRLLSGEVMGGGAHQGNVRGKSAEEMNAMLAEVRKFGQGVMVLDQRPSSLVGGVLDNALINIMCRLHDREGFEHLSHVLNLSPDQQQHAHTSLKPGDALMLDTQSGQPVLLRAPNVVDALSRRHDLAKEPELMRQNAARVGLRTPEAIMPNTKPSVERKVTSQKASWEDRWDIIQQAASLVMRAPFRTCAYCQPLQEQGKCPHRKAIHRLVQNGQLQEFYTDRVNTALGMEDRKQRWAALTAIGQDLAAMSDIETRSIAKAYVYCYFAHLANEFVDRTGENTAESLKMRKAYRFVLYEFDEYYGKEEGNFD
jgi:hypothetical protein